MNDDRTIRQVTLDAEVTKTPLRITETGKHSRVEVTVQHGISATIFDTSISDQHELHATLASESELHIISLSTCSARKFTSHLADGAKIFWHCFTLGDTPAPHSLVSTCTGAHATSDIDWIFSVREKERQTVTVRNIFAANNGGGEITLKGVAQQNGFAVCNGMIEITEEGTGTDTYLTEDVLMLDATAKVDAIPGLEIRTNDVKASHSATVSRVTVEDLFYFQSRGIDSETARRMYTEGFLGDLTERILDDEIHAQVRDAFVGYYSDGGLYSNA